MEEARSYHQHCGLARALDVVGERWTLLIVRELLLGPRRYVDLLGSLDGITTNLLAKRLRRMKELGLIEKRRVPPPVSTDIYALTRAGEALEPAVTELARWGGRLLDGIRPGDRADIGWALLSMKRRYQGGLDFVAEVTCGPRVFELVFAEKLGVTERAHPGADVTVRAENQDVLFGVFFRGASQKALVKRGSLVLGGRTALFQDMARAFAPPK